jgi:hypothetical protein
MLQNLIVAGVVLASFAYATWALMPNAWRLALRRRLGAPLPVDAGGCGSCGGCAGAPRSTGKGSTAVITLHRRPAAACATPPADESAGSAGS